MAKVYGIDLGTTYSVISTLDDNGMPEVIANQDEVAIFLRLLCIFRMEQTLLWVKLQRIKRTSEPERVVEFVKRYNWLSLMPYIRVRWRKI